jgi:hypothetical protein
MTGGPPTYNGTDYQNQPLVDAWFTRGWVAQTGEYNTMPASSDESIPTDSVVAAQPNQYPNFPTAVVAVNVTAAYFDMDGNPLPGFLTFQMSDNITMYSGGAYFRMPQRYAGNEADGSSFAYNNYGSGRIYIWKGLCSVELFATNNAGITTDSGSPFVWNVTEHFLGGRSFTITVPESGAPGPVDINTLINSGSVTAADYDPASPLGFS